MSDTLKKAAGYSPTEMLVLSALAGGAGFGGLRLLSELGHQLSPPAPSTDKIPLDLADPRNVDIVAEETKEEPNMFETSPVRKIGSELPPGTILPPPAPAQPEGNKWYLPLLAQVVGLPAGFLGAKYLYDKYQETDGDKRIEAAKNEYIKQLALAQAMNKSAAETPLIDSFCTAAASELEKNASFGHMFTDPKNINPLNWPSAPFRAMPSLLGSNEPAIAGVSPIDIHNILPATDSDVASEVTSSGLGAVRALADKATGSLSEKGLDAWKLLSGASAIGLLGLLVHNHNKKKRREQEASYPTGIKYAQ